MSDAELRNAILCVLSTLPVNSEMRFYWKDGTQCVTWTCAHCEPINIVLVRDEHGVGHPMPATVSNTVATTKH